MPTTAGRTPGVGPATGPDRTGDDPRSEVLSTCLVELVLSAGEFGPQAEPALRRLRAVLEADEPASLAEQASILRTGMAVTQEFGKLDITLRALVSAADLLTGALLGAQHLRAAVLRAGATAHGAAFQEQSVRASWS